MTIYVDPSKMHWNYYLALEHDMEVVSRYVEFCEPNFSVYSIELAHLLFAVASEVDVVAKLLCSELALGSRISGKTTLRSSSTAGNYGDAALHARKSAQDFWWV